MRNMNDLVRQAGVMQNKIAKMQQEMAERTVEASSGGGMVKVVATCKQDIVSITIDPKALEGGDVEMLQDLVVSAVNEALRQANDAMDKSMEGVTGGLDLSGFGLSVSDAPRWTAKSAPSPAASSCPASFKDDMGEGEEAPF